MSNHILGIDVAKRTFDVALLINDNTFVGQFENSPKGYKALKSWLRTKQAGQVHACLEATGTYGEALAQFLFDQNHLVSVVNPLATSAYGQSKLLRNRTDPVDARLIAQYCFKEQPKLWSPPSAEVVELQALLRRIDALEEMRQMELNRLDTAPAKTKPSIERIIENLTNEINHLQAEINDHLDQHPDLKEQVELLQTIPGIGEKTAQLLLSEIDFSRYSSAREVAAYAGVTPGRAQSGTSINQTNLSKLGNGRLRKGLYFPAIVARQYNQTIKEFAERLAARGKTKMQIVCAAMRKLLHIAFGVLKHKCAYDPNWGFSG